MSPSPPPEPCCPYQRVSIQIDRVLGPYRRCDSCDRYLGFEEPEPGTEAYERRKASLLRAIVVPPLEPTTISASFKIPKLSVTSPQPSKRQKSNSSPRRSPQRRYLPYSQSPYPNAGGTPKSISWGALPRPRPRSQNYHSRCSPLLSQHKSISWSTCPPPPMEPPAAAAAMRPSYYSPQHLAWSNDANNPNHFNCGNHNANPFGNGNMDLDTRFLHPGYAMRSQSHAQHPEQRQYLFHDQRARQYQHQPQLPPQPQYQYPSQAAFQPPTHATPPQQAQQTHFLRTGYNALRVSAGRLSPSRNLPPPPPHQAFSAPIAPIVSFNATDKNIDPNLLASGDSHTNRSIGTEAARISGVGDEGCTEAIRGQGSGVANPRIENHRPSVRHNSPNPSHSRRNREDLWSPNVFPGGENMSSAPHCPCGAPARLTSARAGSTGVDSAVEEVMSVWVCGVGRCGFYVKA